MTGPRRPPGATLREMCGYQWVCTPSRTSAAVAMGLSALVHQAAASWPSRFVAAQPDGALLAGQLLHMVCIFPIAGGRTLGWVESGLEQIVSRAQVPTWPSPGPGSLVPQHNFESPYISFLHASQVMLWCTCGCCKGMHAYTAPQGFLTGCSYMLYFLGVCWVKLDQ